MKQIAHIQYAESSSASVSRSDRDMNVFMAGIIHRWVDGYRCSGEARCGIK